MRFFLHNMVSKKTVDLPCWVTWTRPPETTASKSSSRKGFLTVTIYTSVNFLNNTLNSRAYRSNISIAPSENALTLFLLPLLGLVGYLFSFRGFSFRGFFPVVQLRAGFDQAKWVITKVKRVGLCNQVTVFFWKGYARISYLHFMLLDLYTRFPTMWVKVRINRAINFAVKN